MKRVALTALLIVSSPIQASAQSSTKEKADTPVVESQTLKELKQDVVRLSYRKDGRRVFVLKSDRSLDSVIADTGPLEILNDEKDKSSSQEVAKKPRKPKKKKHDLREFEVTCNPMGEAVDLGINDQMDARADQQESFEIKSKLKSRKMQRLAELACLEPQFENE